MVSESNGRFAILRTREPSEQLSHKGDQMSLNEFTVTAQRLPWGLQPPIPCEVKAKGTDCTEPAAFELAGVCACKTHLFYVLMEEHRKANLKSVRTAIPLTERMGTCRDFQ